MIRTQASTGGKISLAVSMSPAQRLPPRRAPTELKIRNSARHILARLKSQWMRTGRAESRRAGPGHDN